MTAQPVATADLIADYAARAAEQAPPLTTGQRDRLRPILAADEPASGGAT